MKEPKVSIIIPVIAINDYILESIPKILKLDYPDYEILIFPDQEDNKYKFSNTRIIASGKVGPAEKRDLALKHASGEIFAFLDDDAYPKKDWLKKAIKNFQDPKIAAVGGPAITPNDDGILQKVSGAVFESYLGGGSARNRYLSIGKSKETEDWPTVNLLVKKNVFEKIGGFDSTYWPGEDTKLCLDILNLGYKIIYEPKAIVYHHRRSDLIKHFKQIDNYALHRGYFAKIYPKTSRKLVYFVPALFDLYLLSFLILMPFLKQYSTLFAIPLWLYFTGVAFDALIIIIRWKSLTIGILSIPMIFLTHLCYGIRFTEGLLVRKLVR